MSIDSEALTHLIIQFVTDTPHVQGAALVTVDGLPIASHLPEPLTEPRVAAMTAAVLSVGDRIGQELYRGALQHLWIEGEQGYSLITLCAQKTLLLVLASADVKQGVLRLELDSLTQAITHQLN